MKEAEPSPIENQSHEWQAFFQPIFERAKASQDDRERTDRYQLEHYQQHLKSHEALFKQRKESRIQDAQRDCLLFAALLTWLPDEQALEEAYLSLIAIHRATFEELDVFETVSRWLPLELRTRLLKYVRERS